MFALDYNCKWIYCLRCTVITHEFCTWPLISTLLHHPAVIRWAVSITGKCDVWPSDTDARLSVLIVPDPAAWAVSDSPRLCEFTDGAGGQSKVILSLCWVPAGQKYFRWWIMLYYQYAHIQKPA